MNSIHLAILVSALISFARGAPAQEISTAAPNYVQGWAFETEGQFDQAFEAYRKSFEAGEKVKARSPEQKAFDVATKRLGRFEEGIAVVQQAIARAPRAEHHFDLAEFYYNRVKEYEKCREHYQKSYELYLQEGNYRYASRCLRVKAKSYRNEMQGMDYYANVKVRKQYPRIMLELNLKALALNDKVPPDWREHERCHAMEELAWIYGNKWFEGYDPEKSQEYARLAREAGGLTQKVGPVNSTHEQLKAHLARKEYAEALPLIKSSIATDTSNTWLYARLRDTYNGLGQPAQAYEAARRGIDIMIDERNKLKTDREKIAAQRNQWNANIENGITSAMDAKMPEKAYELMEISMARTMLDWIGSRESTGKRQWIDARAREQELLLARADDLRQAVQRERQIGTPQQAESLQRSLVLVEDQSKTLKAQIDAHRRELVATQTVEPISLDAVRAVIGDATLIVYWHALYAAVITKSDVHVSYIRGSSYFPKLVREFREAVVLQSGQARSLDIEGGEEPAAAIADLLAPAQELYRILIKPLEPYIKSDLVYIVPDRMLPVIPFQALHDGQRYFVENKTIVYVPSASVLKYCMAKRRPFGGKVLALGNPNLRDPRFRLVHAEEEVKSLLEIFPDARVLVGDDANEKAVELLGSDVDILHFACHGTINDDDPLLTSLRLSPDKENDGFLHVAEIFDQNISASLVTLSACESGLGKVTQSSEVLGMPRAWMYAGAPSVVASLWKVDDRATSQLMINFYRNLKTMNKAESLRAAQLAMIKEGYRPFHWAAFCLYGDHQ